MISVVVPTYHRADTLDRMLGSLDRLKNRDLIPHEVIVVDNRSPDHTRAVVEKHATNDPSIRYVFENRQGLCHARNCGLSAARGEIVAYLDDDVLLDEYWLVNLERAFSETNAAVVAGRSRLKYEGNVPEWMGPWFRAALSEVNLGQDRVENPDPNAIAGLNLAFLRISLIEIGCFKTNFGRNGEQLLAGEDNLAVAAIQRRGGLVIYDPYVLVDHLIGPERLEWNYFRRMAQGRGLTQVKLALTEAHVNSIKFMLQSLGLVGLTLLRIFKRWLMPSNSYQKKMIHFVWIQNISRVIECWAALSRPDRSERP